ncbi:type II toxin-antitoxin system Phd/YefM family antitoxin [Yersinia sp. 1652 StPb PI]|uniref:type II toxin-antitoxin system Phd/YefM family antitoxin n=1 Tax=unclassified Yersinia (in: enterobacteria) TaxID=2653513 RepID=UPI00355C36B5
MAFQILTTTAASITDLKRNPMGTVNEGEGSSVVILNRNEPAFYCVPPAVYEYLIELAEESALNQIADSRQGEERIMVSLDDL